MLICVWVCVVCVYCLLVCFVCFARSFRARSVVVDFCFFFCVYLGCVFLVCLLMLMFVL